MPFEAGNATRINHSRPIMIVGSYTEGGWAITLKNKIVSLGIFFQPTGLSRLFRIPPIEFSNRAFDANDVLPNGLRSLHDQLATCPSFSMRVVVVERFLRSLVARSSSRDELGLDAAAQIFRAMGTVRMRELAAYYEMSVRQLERRFTSCVGITPGAAPSEILATIRDARPPAMQDFSQF